MLSKLVGTLTSDCLEIGWIDKNNALSAGVSGALLIALEKRKERLIRTPGRAHNRIRSPRLAASGHSNKVGKGSRQIRSVTLGKGLALRVGCRCLFRSSAASTVLLPPSVLRVEP